MGVTGGGVALNAEKDHTTRGAQRMATYGIDEIDGGEAITSFTPEALEESATWGSPVRTWQFFDYTATEIRSDHNHLAMQVSGPDPEVCKRLVRAYYDAAFTIDRIIYEEAVKRHNQGS